MERYKGMVASKMKPFMLQHCWSLLEYIEKWRFRGNEPPPKKGAFSKLDDDESDNEGERNKGKDDGRKNTNDKEKRHAKAASLREKFDDMMKS
jgi:hypothetical protein